MRRLPTAQHHPRGPELYVSQPTVSVALRELEKELQVQLFVHGRNQITPTREGEAFYERAQPLLRSARELRAEFSELGRGRTPVKLGIPPMLGTVFFPALWVDFRRQYPEQELELFEYGSLRAYELVEREELDAALVNLDLYHAERFDSLVLGEEETVLCVARDHPLSEREAVGAEELGELPLMLYNTDSVQNATLHARFDAAGVVPHIILHASQLLTVRRFLLESLARRSCTPFW